MTNFREGGHDRHEGGDGRNLGDLIEEFSKFSNQPWSDNSLAYFWGRMVFEEMKKKEKKQPLQEEPPWTTLWCEFSVSSVNFHFSLFTLFFIFSNQQPTSTLESLSTVLVTCYYLKVTTKLSDLWQQIYCLAISEHGIWSWLSCSFWLRVSHRLQSRCQLCYGGLIWRFNWGRTHFQAHSWACWQNLVPWGLLDSVFQFLIGCCLEATLSSLPHRPLNREAHKWRLASSELENEWVSERER